MSDSQFQDITKSFIKGSSYEKEMIAKNQQIVILYEEINGLAQSITEMKSQMKYWAEEVQKSQQTVKEVTRNEFRLSKQIILCEDEKEKLKKDFQSSQKKYNQLLESMMKDNTKQLEISQHLEVNIVGYEQKISQLELNLQKSEQKVLILAKEVEQQEQKITELSEDNKKLATQLKKLNQANLKLQKQLTDEHLASSQVKRNLNNQVKDLEKLLEQNITDNNVSLQANQDSELDKLHEKLRNYEEEKRELLDKIDTQIKIIVEKEKEFDDLSKLYDQTLDQQAKNHTEITSLNKKISDMMTENCQINLQNENLNKTISSMNDKISKLNADNFILQKDLSEVNTELETLKRDTRNLQQELYEAQRLKQEIQNERVAMKLHEEQYRKKLVNQEEKQKQCTYEQLEKTTLCYIVQILKNIEECNLSQEDQKLTTQQELKKIKKMVYDNVGKYESMFQNGKINQINEKNQVSNKKYVEKKPIVKKFEKKQKK